MRDRVMNELSIGYDPVTFDYDKQDGIRHLREVKLWEVSVVTWAMNPEAVVTNYKNEAAERAKQIAADIAVELKEGRKISTVRLKSLKDACATMESAVKALKAVIKEAEAEKQGGKSVTPPNPRQRKQQKPRQTIEIIF